MKFDVYGRFQLEVVWEDNTWAVYRLDLGKRIKLHDLAIPPRLEADELAVFLDDLFHELSGPGESVRLLS